MKEIPSPQKETPYKMSRAKIENLFDEFGLKYTISGEGNSFEIIIDLPETHIQEKAELMKGVFVSDDFPTKFDKEKIRPLIRKICYSQNMGCKFENVTDTQYILSVFKK